MKPGLHDKTLITPLLLAICALSQTALAKTEGAIEASFTTLGEASSALGNSKVSTTAINLAGEYSVNKTTFTYGFEQRRYSWTQAAGTPFAPGISGNPWDAFSTISLGLEYEKRLNRNWEVKPYIELESAYEKQRNGALSTEIGAEFTYEPNKQWAITLIAALENSDLDGSGFSGDVEIEWNPDAKQGWSGELVLGGAPDITVNYHIDPKLTLSGFYLDAGSSQVRLADNSPVSTFQAGYVEDTYTDIGVKLAYKLAPKSVLSVALAQASERSMTFTNKTDTLEKEYEFGSASSLIVHYEYEF